MNPAIIERSVPVASRFLRRFVLSLRASCALMSVFVLLAFAVPAYAQITWTERTGTVQEGKVIPYAPGETITDVQLPNPSNLNAVQSFWINGCEFGDGDTIGVRVFSAIDTACTYTSNGITGDSGIGDSWLFHSAYTGNNAFLQINTANNSIGSGVPNSVVAVAFSYVATHAGTTIARNFTFSFFSPLTFATAIPDQQLAVNEVIFIEGDNFGTQPTGGYLGVDGGSFLTYSIGLLPGTTLPALPGIQVVGSKAGWFLSATKPIIAYETTSYVITAGDQDDPPNKAMTTFSIGVSQPLSFDPPSLNVVYVVNETGHQIGSTPNAAPLTLPAASGGDGTDHVYTEVTALTAAGLTGTRQGNGEVFISGTPTTVDVTTYAYSVSNTGGMPDATFSVVIHVVRDELSLTQEDLALTAGHVFTHMLNSEVAPPRISGTPTFTLARLGGGVLPKGLAFDRTSRELTSTTLLETSASGDYLYSVTKGGESESTMFEITVNDAVSFAAQPTLSFAEGTGGSATLAMASGGTGTLEYAFTRDGGSAVPGVIGFSMMTTLELTVRSTVVVANGGNYILTATDDNGASDAVTFAINVNGALAFNAAQGPLAFTTGNAGGHTLESATGGVGDLAYKVNLPGETTLPAGYSFNPATLELRSNGATANVSLEYTVTDEDATPTSKVETFMVSHVAAPTIDANLASRYGFRIGAAKSHILPSTSGGTEPLTLKLTLGADYFDTEWTTLNGVTFYPNTPAINGTALAAATYEFTYHVRDAHGVTASSATSLFIAAGALAAPDNREMFLVAGSTDTWQLAEAQNGLGVVTAYSISGTLPTGITANLTDWSLTGTAPSSPTSTTHTVTSGDRFDPSTVAGITWQLIIHVVERPVFTTSPVSFVAATYTVSALSFTSADSGTSTLYPNALTINAAVGGYSPITEHRTEGNLAASGMNIAVQPDESVIISGSPTRAGDYTYTRIAVDSNPDGPREGMRTLTVHVYAKPEFASAQSDLRLTQGQPMVTQALVAASGGFDGAGDGLAYTIEPTTFAAGLTFDGSATPPTISGTPTDASDATVRYTLTATDDNGAFARNSFSVGIAGPLNVALAPELTFTVGESLVLDDATGGVEPYMTRTLSDTAGGITANAFTNGLVFNPETRTIAGQLNVTTGDHLTYSGLTYEVTDANGATANDEFSFTVQPITFIQSRRELLVTRGSNATFTLIDAANFRQATGGTVTYTETKPDTTYTGLYFEDDIGAFVTTTDFDENILPSDKITYIIAAGFQHGGAPAVQTVVITAFNPEELLPINEVVLSEVASASVAGTLGAITDRLAEANILAPYFSIGGQSPLMALATNAKAWADGELDEKEVLNNSQLILPLGVGGGQTIWSQIALWASAHYRNMHGDNDAIDWKGSVSGGHIGFDIAASENMLFGLAFSRTKADMEYRILENDVEGGHIMTLRSVYPYLNWRIGESNLWASVGDGEGEITISQDGEEFESDVGLIAVGLGVSNDVSPQVQLRLEMRGGELDIEGNEARTVLAQDISTNTARAMIKWHDSALRSDMRSAFVEIGVRNDGGDGDTGASMETAMGYKQHSHLATTIEFVIHGLVGREDYNEWGAFGQFRMAAGFDGQGLALRMRPSYGESQGEFGRVWDDELVDKLTGDDDADAYQWRNESRLSYGIQSARGLIAPFGEIISAGDDIYRLGVDWSPRNLWTRHIDLNLTGEHHHNQASANERRVLLQGEVKF